MTDGPYRSGGEVPDGYYREERARYRKLYIELKDEFWEYKQRRWLWFQTSTAILLFVLPLYWALLQDMKQWTEMMEPKHVCDPAPACELHLRPTLDSTRSSH